jgi:anaerobic selenocysteine-containing dehydrogenase
MERREFLIHLASYTTALTFFQLESLCTAAGFHEDGPYNGPLLTDYVRSTCEACPGGCGIEVRRVDGFPVKVEGSPIHPVNRGGLCPVGASSLALLVHPDRIRQPLMRSGPRGSGQYDPIGWEEAETIAVEKLTALRDAGEPERLLILDGRQHGPSVDLIARFAADFGTPNFFRSYDPHSRAAASIWGSDGRAVGYDLENAQLILCFGHSVFEAGSNPVYMAGLRSRLIDKPEGQKGSFVVIDSRLSASAAKAKQWIPIKAGTHGLLALGLIYLIIKERLYDEASVQQHCVGFEDSRDHNGKTVEGFKNFVLRNYYPALVSEKTGVPVDQLIALARRFAGTPRAVAIAGSAASQTVDSVYQVWAIMALNVLAGKSGVPGGVLALKPPPLASSDLSDPGNDSIVAAARRQYPYLSGTGAIEALPEGILTGTPYPIKSAIFNNVNPVYDSPRANRFRQALQNIPFSVAITTLRNETSEMADLILPDCTFFEKYEFVLPHSEFSHPVIGLTQPVIKPLYQSRPANNVVLSFGKRLLGGEWTKWDDYPAYLKSKATELYDSNAGSLFSDEFKVSFESLLAERGWRRREFRDFDEFWEQLLLAGGWWNPLPQFEAGSSRAPTTSGDFHLDSADLHKRFDGKNGSDLRTALEQAGLNTSSGQGYQLATYRDFDQPGDGRPTFDLYLIELTTLRGDGGRLGKMADMVGYYNNINWKTWIELHPETARELNLQDNQEVWVESENGRLRLRLKVNPGLVPGVVAIPAGMGKEGTRSFGTNINSILAPVQDCFTGAPARAETKVKVYA